MAIRLSSENKGSVNMELSKTALAARYAQEAKTASESAQAAAVHPPVIGGNGNWQIWNQGSGAYVDSGICAKGPAGEQGPRGEAGNYTKPAAGIPEEDLSQAVRNKLNSGGASDYADLNNKPGINGVTLSGNKTAAQLGLAAADDVPTKTSQLQNDVGFLAQHQSLAAYRTAAAQDAIDANLMTLGLTGASVGDLMRVAAVDANGKPTSWRKAPLCEIRTNPNLLDNWYFVGGGSQRTDVSCAFPINQRGQTSYLSGYTIDRWFIYSDFGTPSISISSDGITYQNTNTSSRSIWGEKIDFNPSGKTITLSLLYDTNEIVSESLTVPTSPSGFFFVLNFDKGTLRLQYEGENRIAVQVVLNQSTSILLKAIKLEFGTEQTLAHQENGQWVLNEIPDYRQELAKCQRYYLKIGPIAIFGSFGAFAIAQTQTRCIGCIMTPVEMRPGRPTITFANVAAWDGTGEVAITSIGFDRYANTNIRLLFDTSSGGLTQKQAYLIEASADNGYIDISLDI